MQTSGVRRQTLGSRALASMHMRSTATLQPCQPSELTWHNVEGFVVFIKQYFYAKRTIMDSSVIVLASCDMTCMQSRGPTSSLSTMNPVLRNPTSQFCLTSSLSLSYLAPLLGLLNDLDVVLLLYMAVSIQFHAPFTSNIPSIFPSHPACSCTA
jgi:hypothetical protein